MDTRRRAFDPRHPVRASDVRRLRAALALSFWVTFAMGFTVAASGSASPPTAVEAPSGLPTASGSDQPAASEGASEAEQSQRPEPTVVGLPPRATPVVVGVGIVPGAPRDVLEGVATWYDDGAGHYAAVHSYRWGDPTYQVRVTYGSRSTIVTVRDHCACYHGTSRERVIDLSPAAFDDLAPLSRGVIKVVVTPVKGGATLPPTDTR